MAKAKKVVVETNEIELTLSEEEANFVKSVLGVLAPGEYRVIIDNVYDALRSVTKDTGIFRKDVGRIFYLTDLTDLEVREV